MICPMMSRTLVDENESWFDRVNCLKSDCAWWNEHFGACAMMSQELERCAREARLAALMGTKPGPTVADVESAYHESTIPPVPRGP